MKLRFFITLSLLSLLLACHTRTEVTEGNCHLVGNWISSNNSKDINWNLYIVDTNGKNEVVLEESGSSVKVDKTIDYKGFCVGFLTVDSGRNTESFSFVVSGNKELNLNLTLEEKKLNPDFTKINNLETKALINYSKMIYEKSRELNTDSSLKKEEYGILADFYIEETEQFISENSNLNKEFKEYLQFRAKADYCNAKRSLPQRYYRTFNSFPPDEISKSKYDLIEVFNSPYAKVYPSTTYSLYSHFRNHPGTSANTFKESKVKMYELIKSQVLDTTMQQNLIQEDLKYYPNSVRDLSKLDKSIEDYKQLLTYLDDETQRKALMQNLESIRYAKPGASIPDYLLVDNNGKEVKLTSLFDGENYVYIDMWASWCKPCRAEIPALKEVEKLYEKKNIKFIAVSSDNSEKDWKKAINEEGLHGIQLLDKDGRFLQSLQIQGIPRYVLYSPQGKLVNINAPRPSNPDLKTFLDQYAK